MYRVGAQVSRDLPPWVAQADGHRIGERAKLRKTGRDVSDLWLSFLRDLPLHSVADAKRHRSGRTVPTQLCVLTGERLETGGRWLYNVLLKGLSSRGLMGIYGRWFAAAVRVTSQRGSSSKSAKGVYADVRRCR